MNESLVITYWRRGFDTYDIARFIGPMDSRGQPTQEAAIYKIITDWVGGKYARQRGQSASRHKATAN